MKVAILDIETSPNVADVWGLWQQNVGLPQLRETSRVICFAVKWRGEKRAYFHSDHHDGHRAMIERAHEYLDEADVVVSYNGKRFDTPNLRREFLLEGLKPPSPFAEVDLYQVVRSQFKFPSNKLDHVAQALGIGSKVKHEGHALWTAVMAGDPAAWNRMKRYNVGDIRLTEELYERLLPWIVRHPHPGLYDDEPHSCQRCGSTHLQKRGTAYSPLGLFQQYQCQGCGSWSRGGKRLGGVDTRGIQS